MVKQKYAIRFPEIQITESFVPVDLFSERSLRETEQTFLKTFDLMHSLTTYVIEKNRTQELGKQLDARRRVLDAQVEQAAEQERITLVEYSRQLQIQLKERKAQLELEMKMLVDEMSQRVSDFSLTVEEALKTSELLVALIRNEQETLDMCQPYLGKLKTNYARRKEYIQYCDMERKAYERIRGYLDQLI